MAKAHSENSSGYCVKTDYGTFRVCYGCKLLGHCPPAKGSAGYAGHPLHDTRGCQCEHASHFDGSEEETFVQAVEGALNTAARLAVAVLTDYPALNKKCICARCERRREGR